MRARPKSSSAVAVDDSRLFRALICAYFFVVVAPSFVKRMLVERVRVVEVAADTAPTPLAAQVVGVLGAVAVAGVCCYVFLTRAHRVQTAPKISLIAILVLLGGGSLVAGMAGLRPEAVAINVAVLVSLSLLRPKREDLAVFAHLGAFLAVLAICLGLFSEAGWRSGSETAAGDTKALIGTGILAGPFASSNNLGISMALAVTMVGFVRGSRLRRFEAAVMLLTLVLSASRLSMLSLLAAFVLLKLLSSLSNRAERVRIFILMGFGLLAVAAVFPWLIDDPAAFTRRGGIWIASRIDVTSDWLLGSGFDAFGGGAVAQTLGYSVGGAHNPILHALVVGGVISLAGMLLFLVPLIFQVGREAGGLYTPAAFYVFVLLSLCTSEGPLSPEVLAGEGWISLPATALLAWGANYWVGEAEPPAGERLDERNVRPGGAAGRSAA